MSLRRTVRSFVFGLWICQLYLFNCCATETRRTCNCELDAESDSNFGVTCYMDPLVNSTIDDRSIPCQQVNDLVRIGPIDAEIPVTTPNQTDTMVSRGNVHLAPWSFARLMWDQTVHRLQLDLQLKKRAVNALSLGGLENLQELLARTSHLRWDACSLAGLTQTRQILLSCRSEYDQFLTLGPNIEMVRFVDCEETALQFYCISCIQDPNVNVIRLRPGPPLRQYMVKFSHFNRTNGKVRGSEPTGLLSIGKCVPNVCSDSMLCRDNEPLQLVQQNASRPIPPTTVVSTTPVTITTTSVENNVTVSELTSSDLISPSNQSDVNYSQASQVPIRTNPVSNIRPRLFPVTNATEIPSRLDHSDLLTRHQRIWIAASIVVLIAAVLITACVLIGIMRQRNRRQSMKYTRPRKRQTKYSNGHVRDRPELIDADEEGKLELPERVC